MSPRSRPGVDVATVEVGHPRYEELIGQIRGDAVLRGQMWADAEHELVERPGKVWTVVSVWEGGRWVPAAWAAAHVDGGLLRCSDNYERRGAGRARGLYRVAYRQRHRTVVGPSGLPAITYLFVQPIALHEADGWRRTGVAGTSHATGEAHDWWELWRPVSQAR